MSIEGPQSNYLINIHLESVTAATFLLVLELDILPLTNPYPGDRSVLIMDNCHIHDKIAIYLLCARFGVLCFFLPPYSLHYSPIENMFNCTRMLMQQRYGSETIVSVENVFRVCGVQ